MTALYEHIPVLYEAVFAALDPRPGGRYVDATVGSGGHAAGFLDRSAPDGRLLGLDRDPQAVEIARQRLAPFGERVTLLHADYAHLAALAQEHGFVDAQGVLFDLGLSSLQLDRPERGFSFQEEGPLDMRFDPTTGRTAADLVNELSEEELADLLWRYGEERQARRIARRIVTLRRERPIQTTQQLAALVAAAGGRQRGRIHPATKTFMALRIAVNRELERLPKGLEQAVEILAPGGRLAVLAYHSLEDRLVKRFIRQEEGRCDWPTRLPVDQCPHFYAQEEKPRRCRGLVTGFCDQPARLVERGKILPDKEEIDRNPRARSARLRIAERLPDPAEGGPE